MSQKCRYPWQIKQEDTKVRDYDFFPVFNVKSPKNQQIYDLKKQYEKAEVVTINQKNNTHCVCCPINGFIPFQYGTILNENNRVHRSIIELLKLNEVNLGSIKPLIEIIQGVKDKDKDKDKDKSIDDNGFIEEIKQRYNFIDVKFEFEKIDVWLSNHPGRKKTRKFIMNWFSKIEKPVNTKTKRREENPLTEMNKWEKEQNDTHIANR